MLKTESSSPQIEKELRKVVLTWLGRKYLATVCDTLELLVSDRRRYESYVDAIEQAEVPMEIIFQPLSRDVLKSICVILQLDSSGREKSVLIERIVGILTPQPKRIARNAKLPKPAAPQSSSPTRTREKAASTPSRKTASTSSRKTLFISYSHNDRSWLEMLRPHLRPLEHQGSVEIWDDTRIRAGMKWRQEIESAIERARVAVLLVSPHFLASDFIVSNELPPLLDSAEVDGLTVLPVIVSPCRFTKTPSISRYQAVNDPRSTLQDLSEAERNWKLVELTDRIEQCLAED